VRNTCSTSEDVDASSAVRWRNAGESAAKRLDSVCSPTVWSIDLRRGSPVARIAIERIGGKVAYRVLVDGVEVGRSDCVDLILRFVHRLEADPGRAAHTRDSLQDRSKGRR